MPLKMILAVDTGVTCIPRRLAPTYPPYYILYMFSVTVSCRYMPLIITY